MGTYNEGVQENNYMDDIDNLNQDYNSDEQNDQNQNHNINVPL